MTCAISEFSSKRKEKTMKIFVTGDNHIGFPYAYCESLTAKRIDALYTMADKANEERCDLFVVTGDLFHEIYHCSKKDVEKVIDALSRFGGRVLIIPGNHDYYDGNVEVWEDFISLSADKSNIKLLKDYEPYSFNVGGEDVAVYPAFCDKPHSKQGENRLGWIKKQNITNDGKIHIGIAHGTVEGQAKDDKQEYFVMKRSELNSIPVDLWLIGHTHTPFPNDLTEDFTPQGVKIFNPGTHVQDKTDKNTDGLCFIIEIDKDKKIRAKKFVSGPFKLYKGEVNVTCGNMESELTDALKGYDNNTVIVDLTVKGAVSDGEYSDRDRILDDVLNRFEYRVHINSNGLTRKISDEVIKKEFPVESSFSRNFLLDLLSDAKEAQLAYDLIMDIKNLTDSKKSRKSKKS